MEIREVHDSNDGYDKFPVLVKRGKVPKDRTVVPSSFPTISMEAGGQLHCSRFCPPFLPVFIQQYFHCVRRS